MKNRKRRRLPARAKLKESQIPVRLGLTKTGKYRKELIFGTDRKKYNKRNIVETVNSVE